MEAYTHYGKQADVFKHLVLGEVLHNEQPKVYIDTNSACAVYQLEQTPEKDYGIYHFLREASVSNKLRNSFYFKLECEAIRKSCYYGSPGLAMKILKKNSRYYFFDLESESLNNILRFANNEYLNNCIFVQNCDSTKGVMELLPTLPKHSFLHIDPYEIDKAGTSGYTYLDVFIQATRLGMKCLLWYGFMTLDDKLAIEQYITINMRELDIKNIIGSKLIMNRIKKDTIACNPGILGSGLLASNLSEKSNHQLLNLSQLLVETYRNSQYEGEDGSLYNEFYAAAAISTCFSKSTTRILKTTNTIPTTRNNNEPKTE